MFRLALAFVLGLSTTLSVNAQSNDNKFFMTRQGCDSVITVFEQIAGNYGEEPLFTGQGLQFGVDGTPFTGGAMLTVNQDTGTWSLIHLYGDGMACVTAVGTDFEPYVGPRREQEGIAN